MTGKQVNEELKRDAVKVTCLVVGYKCSKGGRQSAISLLQVMMESH